MVKEQKEIPVFFPPMTRTTRAFAAPWKYIQGPGEFDNLAAYSQAYSKNVYVLIDRFLFDRLGSRLKDSFSGTDVTLYVDCFGGECCQKEIDRVQMELKSRGAGLAIAVGGGKTLDTVKAAAIQMNLHVIIVPTSASNDAPVSSLSVVYTDEGVHDHSFNFHRGSDLVLIDSEIVLGAPKRLLVAGMGDALSTYFEARACDRSQVKNGVGKGYLPCKAGMAIAKLCYEILLQDSVKALIAQEAGVVNEAFENIIEANALLSGLGFQNTGCSIAHSMNAGLSELPEAAPYLHGERVAFGVLVQLAFENAPMEEIRTVMDYMASVGLPMTLAEVGVKASKEKIDIMTDKMVYHNGLAHTQAKVVNQDTLGAAILLADSLGKAYRAGKLFS
jgi:glycerol dehydrogenase